MALTTFDEFRSRISIAEIAESIGYWRNPSGGVAKPSYCLGDKNNPQDEIVIYNINNPAKQTYFNRKGSDKGNLINFVENRLDSFHRYTNEKGLKGVNEVLNGYLNNPTVIAQPKQTTSNSSNKIPSKEFNLHYWNPRPLPPGNEYLLKHRRLSEKTVDDFRSKGFIYLAGTNNHIAFPFRTWPAMEINNFEMRNYFESNAQNYKGFPTGGNRTTSSWVASFVPDPQVTDIYIFESCIDAMSFYEINHFTKETTAAFISTGGTITQNQVIPLMKRFPKVKWHSCMDNDASGNVFDVLLAHYLKGVDVKGYANKVESGERVVNLNYPSGEKITIHEDYFSSSEFLKDRGIDIDIIKPRRGKDWNELLAYYKRFDNNLAPDAKVSLAVKETLSQLNLRGYSALTADIDLNAPAIIKSVFEGSPYRLSAPIAESGIYSMIMECDLRMRSAEFVVEPSKLYIFDKASQTRISAQPFYNFLQNEKVDLLKNFHSSNLRNFLEKNTISIKKGGVEKSFEKAVTPSGWSLKEITPIIKNSNTLDHNM